MNLSDGKSRPLRGRCISFGQFRADARFFALNGRRVSAIDRWLSQVTVLEVAGRGNACIKNGMFFADGLLLRGSDPSCDLRCRGPREGSGLGEALFAKRFRDSDLYLYSGISGEISEHDCF